MSIGYLSTLFETTDADPFHRFYLFYQSNWVFLLWKFRYNLTKICEGVKNMSRSDDNKQQEKEDRQKQEEKIKNTEEVAQQQIDKHPKNPQY